MSGVSPLVHISTVLSCTVGSSSEGTEPETELTNLTTYTVTDNLRGWFAAGKMAVYNAFTGCVWYHKAENDSRQELLTDIAERQLSGKYSNTMYHASYAGVMRWPRGRTSWGSIHL